MLVDLTLYGFANLSTQRCTGWSMLFIGPFHRQPSASALLSPIDRNFPEAAILNFSIVK
jgi:hypothetical protein